ncbi:MAG TPA: condensation domain-containing protein, partial [Pyrinomonadaceae bacterium]|nr:condensation domain-containing protein [Pyrinomonadaceae bacterium]
MSTISQNIISLSKEKQALLFERLKQKRDASKLETIPRRDAARRGSLRLSYAQQRLWFIDQLEPGSALYNVPLAIRLSGQLHPQALAASFTELVRR